MPSLLHVPVVVCASHICRQALDIATLRRFDFSIPQKSESVLVSIPYIVILKPWVLDGLEEVNGLYERLPSVKKTEIKNFNDVQLTGPGHK
jgi:hypothetical protein